MGLNLILGAKGEGSEPVKKQEKEYNPEFPEEDTLAEQIIDAENSLLRYSLLVFYAIEKKLIPEGEDAGEYVINHQGDILKHVRQHYYSNQ